MVQQLSMTLNLSSVDYSGRLPSGTEYTDTNASGFNRGHFSVIPTVIVNINDNNVATFSWGGYTGDEAWYVCSQNGYHVDVQYSSDGVNWTDISSAFVNNSSTQSCDGVLKTYQMLQNLVNDLPSAQLTGSGKLRVITWTLRCAPTSSLPNAYPNQVASGAVAADINIELDYRPGATYNETAYMSHNRSGGVCNVWDGTNWVEMKTDGAPTAKGNPPLVYRDGDWYNQARIGEE